MAVYKMATQQILSDHAHPAHRQKAVLAAEAKTARRGRGSRLALAALGLGTGIVAANMLLAANAPSPVLIIGTFLAFAGGLLSTWSPCGYSSLSLLRPHGRYGIRSVARWMPTLCAHAVGFVVTALLLGGAIGAFAWLLPFGAFGSWTLVVIGGFAIGYGLHSLGLFRMPYPQRRAQVSHGARNRYPMWLIGLVYGIQLGLNFVTYVRTPILYVVVALALVGGSVWHAIWLIAALNLGRWMPLLVNALPLQDHHIQGWLASHVDDAALTDGLLLAAAGAAFIVIGAL